MTIVRFVAVAAVGFFGGLMPAWPQGGPRDHTGPSDRPCRREHSRCSGERE